MRQPLVAGNWKMHGSRVDNAARIHLVAERFPNTDVACAVCPPYVYLAQVGELLSAAELPIALGAQDVSAELRGAYTGQVSASMLQDLGCGFVIVGHSERRQYLGEDDQLVARKFEVVRTTQMTPILCVGESLQERQQGRTLEVIGRQLNAVLERSGAGAFGAGVVAYEPCWAIGTGMTASPEQAQEVHAFIRGHLAQQDAKIADEVRILYGGSVNAGNAAQLFAMPDVDGGLIGGASLKAEEFLAILAAASR
ncbi:MAG TPA: triose-phosphate isomerase [Steroidobacteraceae bacterium]|jgi:triosephosphate isomerase|nr:triose-phosphate isomerase [Steroidobacteraceae bacterium]